MFKFSNSSLEKLNTCSTALQLVFTEAIKTSLIDFSIICGHRSVAVQQEYYAQGRSIPGEIITYVDGILKTSKHNHMPSRAVDICAYVNGKMIWDEKHLCYLAGHIMATAKHLGISLTWGGNWDGDGEIISDQKFIDLPHFQEK